jgi:hypothetical protein
MKYKKSETLLALALGYVNNNNKVSKLNTIPITK